MRSDPTNRAMGGADPCRYSDLWWDPDNIVMVERDVVAGTKFDGIMLELHRMEAGVAPDGRGYSVTFRLSLS
jgi:hypothetical protein